MTHVYTKVQVIGSKGRREISDLLVDTGATFTVLPSEILQEIGASPLPVKARLELGDGRVVEAEQYALVLSVDGREGGTLAVTFRDAKAVLGVRTLEDLGLKVDPVGEKLEPTRPPGVAYYYTMGNGGNGPTRDSMTKHVVGSLLTDDSVHVTCLPD